MKQFTAANQHMWNDWAKAHYHSDFYRVQAFIDGTYQPLRHLELNALGNVSGKSLLHLQCHFGQDTLAWARLGATVTGVDFSENAIRQAQELRQRIGMDATFVQTDVLKTREVVQDQFDIVFTSYGVIGWLPDLQPWAKVISQSLKKGGVFYIVEFHPALMIFETNASEVSALQIQYHYFNDPTPDKTLAEGSYATSDTSIKHDEYTWSHSLSEIIQPLLNEGLSLEYFNEVPYSTMNCFSDMREIGSEQYVCNGFAKTHPHLFELKFRK